MPSSHSGSSHSSSSHSSHSSHSSSSHSSHSSSSHSSFSRSSSSSWGSSRSSWSTSRSPSRHSSTSRSAQAFRSSYVRSGSMRGSVIERPRSNQPTGYNPSFHHNVRPITHYCVHHNYVYYPYDWTDENSGRTYKTGYYDENGEYYQDVVFRMNGKYKNVICKCEYCDTVSKIDWSEGGALICPQCGGTMKLVSALDEYTRDPNYDRMQQSPDYVDYADRDLYSNSDRYRYENDAPNGRNGIKAVLCIIIFLFFGIPFFQSISRSFGSGHDDDYDYGGAIHYVVASNSAQPNEPASNPELFGTVIQLKEISPGVLAITNDGAGDRSLVWKESDQSYYDAGSGLWAWYNTEVVPNLWQYWYKPISADYGEYGWMEYDDGTWYIESEKGRWIPVPEKYDTSSLWYIDSQGETVDAPQSAFELFGSEICLEEIAPGTFRISEGDANDKTLIWDEAEQSYHDESSDLWVWYNTDVVPPIWQYWYEPISGDYGDYGWMEYEDGIWFIETDAGSWSSVPSESDTSALWHIE